MWLGAVVLDSNDTESLSEFYKNFLGWQKTYQGEDKEWIVVMDENHKSTPLVFQQNSLYQPPVYPSKKNEPQQMIHLDFYVSNEEYEEKTKHALNCGAVLADIQYSKDWQVFIDPSGHPFCIIPIPAEMVTHFQ